jgi:hypothetical protein
MDRRFARTCALIGSLSVASGRLAAQAAPAAPLDWSADDSTRIAWLEQHGRTTATRYAIVVAPADSVSPAWQQALADSLDRGLRAARALIGAPLPWQRIAERPVKFYLSPDRFVSHASGRDAVFISLWRAREGLAPFLHEATHELLAAAPPFAPWEYPDSAAQARAAARWPLWLTEGLPDYIAQTVAAESGWHEGDIFAIGGLAKVDSVCAARVAANARRADIIRVVGAAGRVDALFTTDRASVAPAFYACAQSMAKYLVEAIGVKRAVALFPAIKTNTVDEEIQRAAGTSLAELRRRWLVRLHLEGA